MSAVGDLWAAVRLVMSYYLTVARHVRRELACWHGHARAIPDPHLRRLALAKLADEHLNAQAAAVFATLAPVRQRRRAARAIVAFQVMYDYLDAVSEEPSGDPIVNGLRLHEALVAAVVPERSAVDYYAFSTCGRDDGGYIDRAVASLRLRMRAMPAGVTVRPALARCAALMGEGQTRTHAVDAAGVLQLRLWGETLARGSPYEWWEATAGAASSLALHALIAAAGDASTTEEDVLAVERAYFPAVCAISTLLDAFADQRSDRLSGTRNYLDYYATNTEAVRRLAMIARDADRCTRDLRRGTRHATIVSGISAFYLSAASARERANRETVRRIAGTLRTGTIRPLLVILRIKRFLDEGE
jgi:tetraprenyl-beta-curcumene synthase